jgi:hypothetical protein
MSVEPPKKIQTQNHIEAVSDAEQLAGRALFTSREWAGEWSGSTGDLTPARPCARWSRPTMKQTWAEKSRTTIVEGSNKKEKMNLGQIIQPEVESPACADLLRADRNTEELLIGRRHR